MKLGYKFGIVTALLALGSLSASAAEMAVLRNGFAIRHERREARDNMTRLYLAETPDNYVDVPTAEIVGFEEVDSPAPHALATAPISNLDAVVSAASSRNNIDPDLINSVIRAESGFNPNAISPKGAQGLMQLMPQTAAHLGIQNAMDPIANVEGGTRYLRELLAHYDNDLIKALAAYNAGPERVEQYHGVPPYPETLAYVARIIRDFIRAKFAQQRPQPDPLDNRGVEQNVKATAPGGPKIERPSAVRDTSSAGAGSGAAISNIAESNSTMSSIPLMN
jgi:soluble lytic murein transglycosylase-like protein